MLISVVICTYNRDSILTRVLDSIQAQSLAPKYYEVIVVDNNSTDNTREISKEYENKIPNLRYCFEPRQGLSHARNRGWREARGEYVGYLDDDAKAPLHWLQTAARIIDEHQPDVFGGPYYPYYDSETPDWWKDSYRSMVLAPTACYLKINEYLSGGNFFIRRSLLEEHNGFDHRLGMKGGTVAVGEETDLLQRIRNLNPDSKVYYDPELFIYHLVPQEKMFLRWIFTRSFHSGQSSLYLENEKSRKVTRNLYRFLMTAYVILRLYLYGLVLRERDQYPYFQNYLVEVISPHFGTLGRIIEELKPTGH